MYKNEQHVSQQKYLFTSSFSAVSAAYLASFARFPKLLVNWLASPPRSSGLVLDLVTWREMRKYYSLWIQSEWGVQKTEQLSEESSIWQFHEGTETLTEKPN